VPTSSYFPSPNLEQFGAPKREVLFDSIYGNSKAELLDTAVKTLRLRLG